MPHALVNILKLKHRDMLTPALGNHNVTHRTGDFIIEDKIYLRVGIYLRQTGGKPLHGRTEGIKRIAHGSVGIYRHLSPEIIGSPEHKYDVGVAEIPHAVTNDLPE